MQANEWGPSAWKYFHTVTFAYPQDPDENSKKNYKDFFNNLKYTLPCSHCRDYYTNIFNYINIDPYLDSRDGLTYWLFIVHNLVNKKLDRKLVDFEDVIIEFENYRARCGSMNDIKKYTQCKNSLKPITSEDIQENLFIIKSKYREISMKQINEFYKSDKIIDPHFKKCKNCNS